MKLSRPIIDWNSRYVLNENTVIVKNSPDSTLIDISLPSYTDSHKIKKIGWSAVQPVNYRWINHINKPIQLNLEQTAQITHFFSPKKLTEVFSKKDLLPKGRSNEFIVCMRSLGYLVEPGEISNLVDKNETCAPDFGVVTLASGEQYIKMAAALAMSVKAQNLDIPFAVITDFKKHKTFKTYSTVFDKIVAIDPDDYRINGILNPYFIKTNIDLLTPYKRTLFLDADSVLFQEGDILRRVKAYKNCDIAPGVSLVIDDVDKLPEDLSFNWGLTSRSLKDLGVKGTIGRIHSYYFYINKTKGSNSYCELARDIYRDFSKSERMKAYFSNHLTDEIPWSLASAFSNVKVFSPFHMPICERLFFQDSMLERSVLSARFEGITFIGKKLSPPLLGLYNDIVSSASRKLQLPAVSWSFSKDGSLC